MTRLAGVIAYWLLLLAVLLILPVFQALEALPEAGAWRVARFAVLIGVPAAALATSRRRFWHGVVVAALILAGLTLFAINQGILREPPSETDVRILQRAQQLLGAESAWDRSASRDCTEASPRRTLYCAIRQASFEATGNFRHRRPALQVVRDEIGVLKPDAHYEHRLSGFNADPSVALRDVQHLLDLSVARIQATLRK